MRAEPFRKKPGLLLMAAFWLPLHCAVLFSPLRSAAVDTLAAAAAAPGIPAGHSESNSQLLPPVVVKGWREPLTEAGTGIGRDIIEALPTGNRSLNELLPILPDIQLSDHAHTSLQGGEIIPPAVSISGGRIYGNQFMIDGLGNNSMLDPTGDSLISATELPGHPQEIFLDPDLIQRVDVYQNNIPARYGGFTGGVVDAQTIDPAMEWSGNLRYRTTRDSWTRFHLDDEGQEAFQQSNSHEKQPEFEIHDAGVTLNVPLTNHAAALLSYQRLYSKIPLRHFLQPRSQHRRLENFFFKYLLHSSADSSLRLTLTSAPYQAQYFRPNYLNSDIKIKREGYQAAVEYRKDFPVASWLFKAGWRASSTERDAPADSKLWAVTPGKSWGELVGSFYSMEGASGGIETRQKTLEVKNNIIFSTVPLGPTSHTFSAGFDYQHLEGKSRRNEQSSFYFSPIRNDSVECSENSPDCVPNEQYFSKRIVYKPQSAQAGINLYDLYAEDILTYKRLELRPGLRLSHDDFMDNLNVGHRLAAAWDLFGNRGTVLTGGINRYYGTTLLTYKLREEKKPITRDIRSLGPDGQPREWENDPTYRYTRAGMYSRLRTPFVDEYTIGLDQQLFGGTASFRYVERHGKDEFAKETSLPDEDGIKHYLLNNNGHSRHRSYVLSWERSWRNHYLQINGTYQKSITSNDDYDEALAEDVLDDLVWYDGHAIHKTDLPRKDYNRPYTVNLIYAGQLPGGFSFSSLIKYRSGYRGLWPAGETHELPDGEPIQVYEEIKQPSAIMVNCKIGWRYRLVADQELLLSVEIDNLLDRKAHVGREDNVYELGRQFWAGVEFRF
jgi:hypothetical protein